MQENATLVIDDPKEPATEPQPLPEVEEVALDGEGNEEEAATDDGDYVGGHPPGGPK